MRSSAISFGAKSAEFSGYLAWTAHLDSEKLPFNTEQPRVACGLQTGRHGLSAGHRHAAAAQSSPESPGAFM